MAAVNRVTAFIRSTSRSNICCFSQNRTTNRLISTSGKNKDTQIAVERVAKNLGLANKVETKPENKDWITYGFSFDSEADDRFMSKLVFFSTISMLMVGGAFILAYQPDYRMADWARREAYLELHRRETRGLPLVDRNLIDPSKIELPSDEELGDFEIII